MKDLRKAAEMALEVMEYNMANGTPNMGAAIEALRQALAQPEQEPVSYQDTMDKCRLEIVPAKGTLLNTTPPKREWVGLTDEEGAEIWGDAHDIDWNRTVIPKEIVKRIEAKLKEKNKREWVGLTKEDMPVGDNPIFDTDEFAFGAAWAQAKLKEKNT